MMCRCSKLHILGDISIIVHDISENICDVVSVSREPNFKENLRKKLKKKIPNRNCGRKNKK